MSIYRTDTLGDYHLSTRRHKSRKERECCHCRQTIKKGEEYTKTVGTYDGYFVSNLWHTECHENYLQYLNDKRRREG